MGRSLESGSFLWRHENRARGLGNFGCPTSKLEQLPCLEAEPLGDQRQIPQANLDLARLHFGQVAAINPQAFGHLELCPALLLPESADSSAQLYTEVGIAGRPPR